MPQPLQIANYVVAETSKQFQTAVKNFIFMRKHKQFKVQKPFLDFAATAKESYDFSNYSGNLNILKTFQEKHEQEQRNNKILLLKQLHYPNSHQINFYYQNSSKHGQNLSQNKQSNSQNKAFSSLKTKIIKKVKSFTVQKQKQRQVQKIYCKYLLSSLYKNTLALIYRGIPPNLSVLETIQDGDYLNQGEHKEYPHYSNVIQPIDLPCVSQQNARIILEPVRLDSREFLFADEEITVFKVKHVCLLLQKIFEQSIKNCSMIRQMNFRGQFTLKLENQNHDFERLGSLIGVSFKTAKLLFDMLNDHYDLEKDLLLGISDDRKQNVCIELIELAKNEIQNFYEQKRMGNQLHTYSCFTPINQYYLSLKELKLIFQQVHNSIK